ncbi:hypothetical protein CDL12_23915 [Handroanthus impetiginosus]|uniref:Uncharacterized protein n=1 Tax=Handroanthus impetiginosus TaxID=429701 RepID=A0A2G9GE46_9LAMI|nr:hypothetical protein CDL12_23915 [Handroanthus impetiginosus]
MVSNKTIAESSICEAYLIQEAWYFVYYHFEPDIQSRRTTSKRNEFNEDFTYQNLRLAGKCTTRYLNDTKFNAAKLHVLINCDEVQDFIR